MELHTSCSTLPIYSLHKIIETLDFRYLLKGYFGGDVPPVIEDTTPFEKIFKKIIDEFNIMSSEKLELKNIKHQILIANLEFKYTATTEVLKLYSEYPEIEVLVLLNDLGWAFDTSKTIGPQIDKISKACVGLKMKIKIQKASFSKKYEAKEKKTKEGVSLDKEALYLESNLELGYHLDTKTTSCERWCNLKKLAKEKADHHEKLKQKRT